MTSGKRAKNEGQGHGGILGLRFLALKMQATVAEVARLGTRLGIHETEGSASDTKLKND